MLAVVDERREADNKGRKDEVVGGNSSSRRRKRKRMMKDSRLQSLCLFFSLLGNQLSFRFL